MRKDNSIRRHWQMVCWAFAFCWWESAGLLQTSWSPGVFRKEETSIPADPDMGWAGKKEDLEGVCAPVVLGGGAEEGEGVAGALRNAHALLGRASFSRICPRHRS